MMKKIKTILKTHKELLMYLVFGVLTTLVNFIAFWVFDYILGNNLYLISNAIAWIISVIFAYITNKLYVFNSKSFTPKIFFKEFIEFLFARIFSFAIEELGMWLFVDILNFGEYSIEIIGLTITGQLISKLFLSVIVVIMNYFFSKFFIFTSKTS